MIRLWNISLSPIPIFVGILLFINLIQNHALYSQAVTDADSTFVMTQIDSARGLYKQQQIEQSLLLLHKVEHQARQAGFERGLAEVEFMRARCWNKLGQKDRALDHYSNAIEVFINLNLIDRLSAAYVNSAIILTQKGELIRSLAFHEKAFKIQPNQQDPKILVSLTTNQAITLRRMGRYEDSVEKYFFALNLVDAISDSLQRVSIKGRIYFNIASVYSDQKLYKKALEYLGYAQEIFHDGSKTITYADILNSTGSNFKHLDNLDTAEYLYQNALLIYEDLGDDEGAAIVKCNLSNLRILSGDNLEAIELSNEALQKHIELNNGNYIPECHLVIGKANFQLGNIIEAELAYQTALKKSIVFENKLKEYEIYESLISLYRSIGDLQSAIFYYEIREALGHELFSSRIGYNIAESEISANIDEKNVQISSLQLTNGRLSNILNRTSLTLIIALLCSGIIVLSLVVFVQRREIINRRERVNLEHKVLLNQLKPHFIFNILAAIQQFIFENSTDKASTYLTKFGSLARGLIEESRKNNISILNELKLVRNYLELQKLRFNHQFKFKLVIDEDIYKEKIFIPTLLIQPAVENAVEHGMSSVDGRGTITVYVNKTVNKLKIRIADTGSEPMKKNYSPGYGIKIIKERIQLLNRKSVKPISFFVERNQSVQETNAIFEFPLSSNQ